MAMNEELSGTEKRKRLREQLNKAFVWLAHEDDYGLSDKEVVFNTFVRWQQHTASYIVDVGE
jgi:hypothetical protein